MAVVTVLLDDPAARAGARHWLEQGYDVVCALAAGPVDLAVVDALAQLQLLAQRYGRTVRVGASDAARLRELLEVTGLSDLLVVSPVVEVGRQAEPGEQ